MLRIVSGLPRVVALCVVLAACNSSNPVAPPPPDTVPPGASTWEITLRAVPPQLDTGGSGTITIRVVSTSGQNPPPNGSRVSLDTSAGSFGVDDAGDPVTETRVSLSGGAGQTPFFAGEEAGTAEILALFEDSTASVEVTIVEPGTPPFFLTAISPDQGGATGGETVTIEGRGFSRPLRVTFGDVAASIVDGSVTATSFQAVSPTPAPALEAGEIRRVDVTVTIDLDEESPRMDTLPGAFAYVREAETPTPEPAIFSVSPPGGPNAGGTMVTITGQNFEAGAEVLFGLSQEGGGFQGAEAMDPSVSSDGTQIVVDSPAATGFAQFLTNQLVDIKVTNPSTRLSAIAQAVFQYGGSGGTILVTDFTPQEGARTGLDEMGEPITVTLTGQGFGEAGNTDLAVSLAGVAQRDFSVKSSGSLEITLASTSVSGCSPPSGPPVVTRLVTGESATGSLPFTYTVEQPRITEVVPVSGAAAGGSRVTLFGSDFQPAGLAAGESEPLEVTFGGVRATVLEAEAGKVQVRPPSFTGSFEETESCTDSNGDAGVRDVAAVDVVLTNQATGCTDTFAKGYTYKGPCVAP